MNDQEAFSSAQLKQWAEAIKMRRWEAVATLFLEGLQIWGFIGAQILWMLAPFLGKEMLAPYAEVLEQPEALRQLQRYLLTEDE